MGSIEAAHKSLSDRLIRKSGVAGTAIGECGGAPCIKVYLERRSEELLAEIPSRYQGFRVSIEETGTIRPR